MHAVIVCVGCTYSMVIPNDVQKQTFLRTNNDIEPIPHQFNLIAFLATIRIYSRSKSVMMISNKSALLFLSLILLHVSKIIGLNCSS